MDLKQSPGILDDFGKNKNEKKKNKKHKTLDVHKKRRAKKINFDVNLKNWKYIIPTFSDLELDVISQFQEGEIGEYPDWFILQNNEFLQHTAGSGFFFG